MSMTRDEAIKHLLHDWCINLGCDFAIKPGRLDDFLAALDVALSALRPITREQVEKVWRGEWIDCSNGWMCSRCEHDNTYAKPFCPNCGAPMTDKAVDMVMERMEAINEM